MSDRAGPPEDVAGPEEDRNMAVGSNDPAADGASARDGDSAQTLGAALRSARLAAGLELADVADRTKVRPGILTAIEDDRHDDLPALTYSLGFVKAFARTVGLDPQEAADRFRRESMKGEPVPTIVDLEPLDEQRIPSRGLVALVVALLLLALAGFWAWGAGLFEADVPLQPRVADATEPDAPPPASATGDATGDPAPPPMLAGGAVVLVAREEVWLRIDHRDTGERFFEGTMAQGQELAIPPGQPLQLRTGRAGAIEVRVGDRVLPPLGGPAQQLRNLSLLPADLQARQEMQAPATTATAPTPGLADARLPPTS